MIKKFVFNDDNVMNSYGFYINTAGIDMTRFTQNPVMLSNHINTNENVVGNWLNIVKLENTIEAEPQFDVATTLGADISGKVERGFLKGCSMGVLPNWDKMEKVANRMILMECQLVECSIVPVPSNANSIAIYSADGTLLPEDEVKNLCLSVNKKIDPKFKSKKHMKKVILSVPVLMALGLTNQSDEGTDVSVVETTLLAMAKENHDLKTQNKGLLLAAQTIKEAQDAATKNTVITAVELAIAQGKIGVDKKETFVNLGLSNHDVLQTTLEAIPAKTNFGAGVVPATGAPSEVKTMEDFQKLSVEAQLAFKADAPDEYKKLFS